MDKLRKRFGKYREQEKGKEKILCKWCDNSAAEVIDGNALCYRHAAYQLGRNYQQRDDNFMRNLLCFLCLVLGFTIGLAVGRII